ncbi:hypothetical protein EJ08DRAFT_666199 [Tothia fuscella]|uniref:Uncharacterized protein n=1 Tax=Tothia fuscella TaxID=1048955 RepID=A0A9P4NF01_9PEZI|nr:hypothetical protein EJ08DRAFT_666199 [Tothia fuscella]
MPITFYPSQVGNPNKGNVPIAYTGDPLQLIWSDVCLIWKQRGRVGGIFLPLRLFKMDKWDELYPSPKNLVAIITHFVLTILQLCFICSIFVCIFTPVVPLWAFIVYCASFLTFNHLVCRYILNKGKHKLESDVGVKDASKHQTEYWIYLNGVSVGADWLQANCDRLSHTFGRRIVGILNPTDGIIFDLIQCMVQRNLSYSTSDVRDAYQLIKEALLNEEYSKVVFILHSQGGIEGGLVVDWLLDEIPQDRLQRLEVYTFGNAANHFNNPHRSLASAENSMTLNTENNRPTKALRYVEHYANDGDFVAQFGVLNFTQVSNRFMGRVFKSPNSGHLLNMHYLHEMFPLETVDGVIRAKDVSEFMEMSVTKDPETPDAREDLLTSIFGSGTQREAASSMAFVGDVNTPLSPLTLNSALPADDGAGSGSQQSWEQWKVKHFSRLWQYRNGNGPPEDRDGALLTRATF